MNWQIFSIIGYVGVGLCLALPFLWWGYWRSQRPRLRHVAVLLALAAFVCARLNSARHVYRIEAAPNAEEKKTEDTILQAALEGRKGEVAQITFAEDGTGDFLDKAGMDEADLKYLGGDDSSATPEWKRQKQVRSQGGVENASPEDLLTRQIGGEEAVKGVDAEPPTALPETPVMVMSAADVATARRFDRLHLGATRLLIIATLLLLVVDYLRRANIYSLASLPLRLPSAWLNAFTPMPPLMHRPQPPRRSIPAELEWLSRRGDVFVYMTDRPESAEAALAHLQSLPKWRRPDVLRLSEGQEGPDDDFVFESLWYGRCSFVVDSLARLEYLLPWFMERLEERRATRARVRQTVHLVWDAGVPLPESVRDPLVELARAAGFSLFLCQDPQPSP